MQNFKYLQAYTVNDIIKNFYKMALLICAIYAFFCIFESPLKFVKYDFKNISNESYNLILFVREFSIHRNHTCT